MTNSSSKIRDELWAEACRREEVLRDLMRLHPGRFPETAVPDACVALGVSRATLFRLIERFKTEQTVSALLPRKCGRAAGSKNYDPKRDRLIRRTIERLYLTPERASFARLVEEIRLLCVHEGLASPSWRAVRARLAELDLRKHALRRDDKLEIAATKATAGEYRATRPFRMSRSIT
jgi:putative transposase